MKYQVQTSTPGLYIPIEADSAQEAKVIAEGACQLHNTKPVALWLRTAVLFGTQQEPSLPLPFPCSPTSLSPSQQS